MSGPALDASKQERFHEKMRGALNGAALALMTSIGHRTGLFDVMSRMRPATSAEIASAAGLDERYVREWLGAMVTGGVVEYDPAEVHYALPREHAALLTRAARPGSLAATCQWIPVLGAVEDQIVECFERGGGVALSAYPRFHSVMADESGQTVVGSLVERVLPLAPGLRESLEAGIDVLDVGCGSGRALNRLAARFPASRFTGYDNASEAVDAARNEARARGLTNVRFAWCDFARHRHEPEFDCVLAFGSVRGQAHPERVLANIANVLRPEGVLIMQDAPGSGRLHEDVAHPLAPFLYTLSCLHSISVSLAEGGAGLGAMWGADRALGMLAEAGFSKVEVKRLSHDATHRYFIARK
jgi:SAM-dependent methyltransferase